VREQQASIAQSLEQHAMKAGYYKSGYNMIPTFKVEITITEALR